MSATGPSQDADRGTLAATGELPTGPLHSLRVVELASEHAALAGKMLGDMGAEVIVVEPPGGHRSRQYPPFAFDVAAPDHGLWWWYYNTSKRSVVLDIGAPADAEVLHRLVRSADIFLEGEPPGWLAARGFDHRRMRADAPQLIWLSITPFGSDNPRSGELATDLTIAASAGPAWSAGYHEESVGPVRPGGNQAYHTAAVWATMGALTAVLHRHLGGSGQHVDVSMHAAANVTTEAATYEWLVAGRTVQRQTGRHAAVDRTAVVNVVAADGIEVTTGVPPRSPAEFAVVARWVEELGLRDVVDDYIFLELGAARDEPLPIWEVGRDPEVTAMFAAGRDALVAIARRLPAKQFFVLAQRKGLPVGAILAPEEVAVDEHFAARGFPTPVEHPELGRTFVYPGAPFRMSRTPWRVRRAPLLDEHSDIVGLPSREHADAAPFDGADRSFQ